MFFLAHGFISIEIRCKTVTVVFIGVGDPPKEKTEIFFSNKFFLIITEVWWIAYVALWINNGFSCMHMFSVYSRRVNTLSSFVAINHCLLRIACFDENIKHVFLAYGFISIGIRCKTVTVQDTLIEDEFIGFCLSDGLDVFSLSQSLNLVWIGQG